MISSKRMQQLASKVEHPNGETAPRLFNTRYDRLASNTIDYWMLPEDIALTESRLKRAIADAPVVEDASLQIYIHVPFCAQRCRFCAFSGGNSLDLKQAEQYSRLVVQQIQDLLNQTQIKGQLIRSINVGGGSPDLLRKHAGYVLKSLRDLPGCTDRTEISVEFTLSTTTREFIEELVRYNVTKASFGLQSLDPVVRGYMRQPRSLAALDRVLNWIDGRIPVINADLMTGLPGQTIPSVASDLCTLMSDRRINAISSYLLTTGAAPSLVAGLAAGELPEPPSQPVQAHMRAQTYGTFLRAGWIRKGTNTYCDPSRMSAEVLDMIAGNECIGTSHYEAFLLAAGPQSISHLPGARLENCVDVNEWSAAMERGSHPFHLPKCTTAKQEDTALWVFPLRWEGLPHERYERMKANGALTSHQIATFENLEQEGLIVRTNKGYELSVVGEVFMGQMVRELKSEAGRRAVDNYIAEGNRLGQAIQQGRISDKNDVNNRQHALTVLPSRP